MTVKGCEIACVALGAFGATPLSDDQFCERRQA